MFAQTVSHLTLFCAHQALDHHYTKYEVKVFLKVEAMAPRKEKTEKATADQGDDTQSSSPGTQALTLQRQELR